VPEQEEKVMQQMKRRSRHRARQAEKRAALRLDELLLQEAFRQDALHHGLPVAPEVVVVSDSSDNEE
jgi:hypothetical protein